MASSTMSVGDVSLRPFFQAYFDPQNNPLAEGELLYRPTNGTPADVFFHSLCVDQQFVVLQHQLRVQARLHRDLGTNVGINIHNSMVADDEDRRRFLRLAEGVSESVTFEFTETFPMPPALEANRFLRDLRSLGHRSALDDFGTGLNGVSLLTDYDFDVIKVDRFFVTDIEERPERQGTLRVLSDMFTILGKEYVVEGVETVAARDVLVELGYRIFQGFLFGLPEPVDQLLGEGVL